MKKIAILNDPYNFHTQKWAVNLQKVGLEVLVVSFEKADNSLPFPYLQLPIPWALSEKSSLLHYLVSGKSLYKILKSKQIDCLFAINLSPCGILARRSGFHPTISFAVGADVLEFPPDLRQSPMHQNRTWIQQEQRPQGFLSKIKLRFRYTFLKGQVREVVHFSDYLIADNQVLIDALGQWFGAESRKLRLIRGGVEPEFFEATAAEIAALKAKFRLPEDKKIVLCPRGMKPIYQTDIVLEGVAAYLEQGGQGLFFLFLGTYESVSASMKNKLLALAESYPDAIHLHEAVVNRKEMSKLWMMTEAFISAPIYDGYSASVAEGRFVGAIPIVNDTAATRELFQHRHNAWIVDPFEGEQVRKALVELQTDWEGWHQRFRQINQNWIAQHSLMEESARQFKELCGEVGLAPV